MKKPTPYQPFEHFVFRTPLFPYGFLYKEDELMQNNAFIEALQIATPDLSEGIDKGEDRAQYSACRYYQRACTRPTPFGLFAGCSVGTIGERTEIQLSEQQEYKRTTRLDMNYICALTQLIERDKNTREHLRFFPNNSIYPIGDRLRYVEYHYRKTRRIHRIEQVKNSAYIQAVLDLAKTGVRFSALAASLTDDETTMEEAAEFIHELIDIQLLVSELEPSVTNTQPLTALLSTLNGFSNGSSPMVSVLTEMEAQLNDIDRLPIGDSGAIYPAIIKNIEKTKIEAEIKYLFQTDMFKPAQQATVSRQLMRDIQQALIFLNKITPPPLKTNLA